MTTDGSDQWIRPDDLRNQTRNFIFWHFLQLGDILGIISGSCSAGRFGFLIRVEILNLGSFYLVQTPLKQICCKPIIP